MWFIVIHGSGVRFVGLLIEVLTIALGVEFALRRWPFERVLAQAAHSPRRTSGGAEIATPAVLRAIRVAYRILPLESTCLKHSLIFCRVRRRRGLPAELRIGVQKHEGVFAAHAWVEDGAGNVLTDPQEGFSPVPLRPARPGGRASD